MKTKVLTIFVLFCSIQMCYSQEEDGVVALNLPVRNSLKFNRYIDNPTFSFVREQNKYISIYNKREWVQFEDAPQTYIVSYSGRFRENIGLGVGVFQQNYGVLTTFGGLLNFAYNAQLDTDSNLTFGLNLGAYKSGLNSGKVVTNFPDPSLDNIPSNFLLTANPGINYGTAFLDFGVSLNNLVLYNINTSEMIEDNPQQGIQGHIMYTGYIYSTGFFDESRFSGLMRTEFLKDETIISGNVMLMVPKGIWGQVGYNTLYGASAGIGLNITQNIAIEYNFEKALGDLTDFGPSHEITLAYKFNNTENYDYSREDDVSALISTEKRRKPVSKISKQEADANRKLAAEAKLEAEAKAIAQAEAKAKADAEAKAEADRIRLAADTKANEEAKAKADAEAVQLAAAAKLKAEEDAKAQLEAERLAKEVAEAKAKIAADNKAKAEAKAKEDARLAAEAKAKEDARLAAEAKAQESARLLAEAKAKEEARVQAEAKAKEDARLAAEVKAQEEARLLAEAKAKEDARILAEAKAKEDARLAAEVKAQEEARLLAEAKAKEESVKLAAEEKAKADAQLAAQETARLAAEAKAKEDARLAALAKEAQEAKAKEETTVKPTDPLAVSMDKLAKQTEESENTQAELLKRLSDAVASKDKDLKDLKEENDLSDKGIYMEPKPFKSVTEENNAIEALKADIDAVITDRNKRIKELEDLYEERMKIATMQNDTVNLYYQRTIKKLKAEQLTALQTKARLTTTLEDIKEATEVERKRRIKRAAYDNEQDRFIQDKATLNIIKQNTSLSNAPLKATDFDYGEEQSDNIQILKNVKNVESGYYMIIAVHNDVDKRNEFVTKVVASGRRDVEFFYDVNTSKYYIYYQKFDSVEDANEAIKSKGNRPYNGKLSIVKIEN